MKRATSHDAGGVPLAKANGLGMRRSPSEQAFAALRSAAAASGSFHQESRWEAQGGWRSTSKDAQRAYRMERDSSMVKLLNLIDPGSLVDSPPTPDDAIVRTRTSSFEGEQHSALSARGIAIVGGGSALAWYALKLVLRDLLGLSSARGRQILELHCLSSLHAVAWLGFLLRKVRGAPAELPAYCSRALVGSLGFYIHDCWALRGTLLHNPALLAHQASVAATIVSILRSKGVAWLAPPLMSLSVPTIFQEVLQLCGTIGLPATRPEVRGLRLLWFASFAASKLALVPLWMRYANLPELHQPNLLLGKFSYLVGLALNLRFLAVAARDLPRFLRPQGAVVSAAVAYRVPLRQARSASSALAAAVVLGGIFGSYLTAPVAALLALVAWRRRSRGLGMVAGGLSAAVVADSIVPMPRDCSPSMRKLLPLLKKVSKAFKHRFYSDRPVTEVFHKDRHHLFAITPHGFFPWAVMLIIIDLLEEGYLPNFIGASVLGALPGAGRLLRAGGFRPATRKEISRCLEMEYPRNVTIIVPGGIAEMFTVREDIEVSVVNKRTGFLEVAAEKGAIVVPGYILGHSQLYQVAKGSLGHVFEQISRHLKVSLNLFHGRWGTLLPYPHPVACALGRPIDTREVSDPQELQRVYVKNTRDAFEEYKADFGWADRQLFFEGEEMPREPQDPLEAYSALPPLSRL